MVKGQRYRYVAFRLDVLCDDAGEAPDAAEGPPSEDDGPPRPDPDAGRGPVTFRDLVGALRRLDDDAWLIAFDGRHGIVRCPHTDKEGTVALLSGIDRVGDVPVAVETLGTSGTIKRCRAKFLPTP